MPPRFTLSLCTIFKNEARYLREWIELHLLTGVEHFYLYENLGDDDYASVLEPYVDAGIVTLHTWAQHPGQIGAYTHCAATYAGDSRWIGFVDADEFFFAPDGRDLRDALAPYDRPEIGAVCVNYVNYGTSGHVTTPDGLVVENYLRRAGHETAALLPAGLRRPDLDPTDPRSYYPLNSRISSVARPDRVSRFVSSHYAEYRPGFHAVTERFEPISGPIAERTSVSVLRMNHYWTKSEEECRLKFQRGRSDNGQQRAWPDEFLARERALNEVVDVEILRWLEPLRDAMGVTGPSISELARRAEANVPVFSEAREAA
ncbi:MAG: glycosyltransferase family 92 protein [Gaiella sp.]